MAYHDDLVFVDAEHIPACQVRVDRDFPDTWSLEYAAAGRLAWSVGEGAEDLLSGPVAFWHLPGRRYRYGAVDRAGWDHHWVLVQGSRARRLIGTCLDATAAAGWLPVARPEDVGPAMRRLIGLVRDGLPRAHARAVALVEFLVAELVTPSPDAPADPYAGAIETLAADLRADPCRRFDVAVEAGRLGLSVGHFRRLFRRRIGVSPHAFLLTCRMRMAAERLRGGDEPVGRVAEACGYTDQFQFSKLFKRKLGLSPSAYRRAAPSA